MSEELSYVNAATKTLHTALVVYEGMRATLGKMSDCQPDQKSLVQLANGFYMTGELVEPQKVVIDIGTNYYIEVSIERAVDFCARKFSYIHTQLTKIEEYQKQLTEKMQNLQLDQQPTTSR